MYSSHFLLTRGKTDIYLDAFRLCEAALEIGVATSQFEKGWTLPDDTQGMLENIPALHDQQLALVSEHQFNAAWERLERFLASDARSPLLLA